MIMKQRDEVRKERRLMRVWTYLGMFLAFLVIVFGLVNIAGDYLFVLLAVSVLLLGIGTVTNQ